MAGKKKKGESYGNTAVRRVEIAKMYARGVSPTNIWKNLIAFPEYEGMSLKTIYSDIRKIKEKWGDAYKELNDLENPRLEYELKNADLREMALKESVMEDGRKDVRNIKLASDLDKDLAKVQGVYSEKIVIQVEDAQKLIARITDIIDTETDGDLRERMMDRLLSVADEI